MALVFLCQCLGAYLFVGKQYFVFFYRYVYVFTWAMCSFRAKRALLGNFNFKFYRYAHILCHFLEACWFWGFKIMFWSYLSLVLSHQYLFVKVVLGVREIYPDNFMPHGSNRALPWAGHLALSPCLINCHGNDLPIESQHVASMRHGMIICTTDRNI